MESFTIMSPRRSSLDITVDVLQIIKDGKSQPTHIMYACNLSWNSLKKSLTSLSSKKYLKVMTRGKKKQYSITKKGIDVLGYYSNLENMVQIF
jgi:predicted transcriptional regulator